MDSNNSKQGSIDNKAADTELLREEITLNLLARGAKIKNIAIQVNRSEKWVRDLKNKARKYPASLVSDFSPIVQSYLVAQQPSLKVELEEFRRSTGHTSLGSQLSASEIATFKHWEELSSLAGDLVSLWEKYHEGHPIGGYYGYIIDDPVMIELPGGMLNCLLLHLKSEFKEYDTIGHWQDLLKTDTSEDVIMKLALVAHRKTLKGSCPICPHEN